MKKLLFTLLLILLISVNASAAVEYVLHNQYTGDDVTSLQMTIPVGWSVGDCLIAYISKDDDIVVSDHADWTTLVSITSGTGNALYVAWRLAVAGDTNWTFTSTDTAEDWIGEIFCYTGNDTTNPIYDSGSQVGTTTTPTAPSVAFTDLAEGSLVLQVFGADDNDIPYTVPVQLTSRFNIGFEDTGGAGGERNLNWISPTGFVDETSQWTNEANVYDKDTTTYGYDTVLSGTWGGYLDLTIDVITCDKVRFWAIWSASYIDEISLDVYYTGAWHNIYEGVYTHLEWIEKEIGSIESVTAMRARFHNTGGNIQVYWHEADFWETGIKTGSTGTAVFTQNAAEQWAAATVIIKAAAPPSTNWVSPTGHSDPDNKWINEEKAYDGGTGYGAKVFSPGHYLILTLGSAISCDRVKIAGFSIYKGTTSNPDIDVDVYYSGAYYNIYSGTIVEMTWTEMAIGSTESVDKARIKWNVCTEGWSLWNNKLLNFFNDVDNVIKWNGVEIAQSGDLAEFYFGEVQ